MRIVNRHLSFAMALALSIAPVATAQTGQRAAVASSLTPEDAASIFNEAVIDGCLAAVAANRRLPDVMGVALSTEVDAETRQQSGALADEAVYDVIAGKGVVTAHDKPGRCVVSVYGPPAAPTLLALARELSGGEHGLERLAAAASPTGLGASLFKVDGTRRLQVMISGSEPGMPGHKSRFSVVTATVFATPAG